LLGVNPVTAKRLSISGRSSQPAGDLPLLHLRFRCPKFGSRLTGHIVMASAKNV
jgi:hypothetical protein